MTFATSFFSSFFNEILDFCSTNNLLYQSFLLDFQVTFASEVIFIFDIFFLTQPASSLFSFTQTDRRFTWMKKLRFLLFFRLLFSFISLSLSLFIYLPSCLLLELSLLPLFFLSSISLFLISLCWVSKLHFLYVSSSLTFSSFSLQLS